MAVLQLAACVWKASLLLSSPGMTEMVRKITLSRAVRIMQSLFPEEYNFYPRSWILPDEFQLFAAQVDAAPSPWPLDYTVVATVSWELGQGVPGKLRLAQGVFDGTQ